MLDCRTVVNIATYQKSMAFGKLENKMAKSIAQCTAIATATATATKPKVK